MSMSFKKKLLCWPLILGMSGALAQSAALAAQQPLISFATTPIQVSFPVQDSILTFLYVGPEKNKHIEVHALIPEDQGFDARYVGMIESKGSAPVIESTFLFNVDSDPEHELFVLTRWDKGGPAGKDKSAIYKTYVFDQPTADAKPGSLRLREIEDRIDTAAGGRQDPDTVRDVLKTLGY